jgi:hypothetical protein
MANICHVIIDIYVFLSISLHTTLCPNLDILKIVEQVNIEILLGELAQTAQCMGTIQGKEGGLHTGVGRASSI